MLKFSGWWLLHSSLEKGKKGQMMVVSSDYSWAWCELQSQREVLYKQIYLGKLGEKKEAFHDS